MERLICQRISSHDENLAPMSSLSSLTSEVLTKNRNILAGMITGWLQRLKPNLEPLVPVNATRATCPFLTATVSRFIPLAFHVLESFALLFVFINHPVVSAHSPKSPASLLKASTPLPPAPASTALHPRSTVFLRNGIVPSYTLPSAWQHRVGMEALITTFN